MTREQLDDWMDAITDKADRLGWNHYDVRLNLEALGIAEERQRLAEFEQRGEEHAL